MRSSILAYGLLLCIGGVSALSAPVVKRNNYCSNDILSYEFSRNFHAAELFCCDFIHYPTTTKTIRYTPVKTTTKVSTITRTTTSSHGIKTTKSTTLTKSTTATVSDLSSTTISSTTTTTDATTTTQLSVSTAVSEFDTTTTITTSASTTTPTTITTISTDATVTTSTETSVLTTTTTTDVPYPPVRKRDVDPWKMQHPPPCDKYKFDNRQLSSACSCLHLTKTETRTIPERPSTYTKVISTTKVLTKTITATGTKTTTIDKTNTKTSTFVNDVSFTDESTATAFTTDVDSATSTTTTISTSVTTSVTTDIETTVSTDISTSMTSTTSTTTTTTSTTTTSIVTDSPCPVPARFNLGISSLDGTYVYTRDLLFTYGTQNANSDGVNVILTSSPLAPANQQPGIYLFYSGTDFLINLDNSANPAAFTQFNSATPSGQIFFSYYSQGGISSFLDCSAVSADATDCNSDLQLECQNIINLGMVFSYCPGDISNGGMGLALGTAPATMGSGVSTTVCEVVNVFLIPHI